MTGIVEAVQTVLAAYTDLTDIVNDRIYPIILPQDVVYPAVTSEKISGVPLNTMADSTNRGVENYRIRLSAWAETLKAAQAVSDELLIAMKAAADFEAIPVFDQDFHETSHETTASSPPRRQDPCGGDIFRRRARAGRHGSRGGSRAPPCTSGRLDHKRLR